MGDGKCNHFKRGLIISMFAIKIPNLNSTENAHRNSKKIF